MTIFAEAKDFDARLMISGWNEKGFDDSGWSEAEKAPEPRGRLKPCTAEPIVTERELTPVTVTCGHDGTLFDFGVNTSGVPRLRVRGERGTTVTLTCGELLRDGCLTQDNIKCDRDQRCQVIKYTLAGDDGTEEYVPFFTYCGCRYVLASSDRPLDVLDISFLVRHSGLKRRGSFRCSDETVNRLQEMTERSTLSNFWYFPTDCPHREKNGWTATPRYRRSRRCSISMRSDPTVSGSRIYAKLREPTARCPVSFPPEAGDLSGDAALRGIA